MTIINLLACTCFFMICSNDSDNCTEDSGSIAYEEFKAFTPPTNKHFFLKRLYTNNKSSK